MLFVVTECCSTNRLSKLTSHTILRQGERKGRIRVVFDLAQIFESTLESSQYPYCQRMMVRRGLEDGESERQRQIPSDRHQDHQERGLLADDYIVMTT